MAKRKDLLLNESTVSRMMGLAGIGALTNPFLRESSDMFGDSEHTYHGQSRQASDTQEEEEMDEAKCPECGSELNESRMCECGYGKMEEELDDMGDVASSGGQNPEDYLSEESDPWSSLAEAYEDEEDEEDDEEDYEDDEEDESLQENINASLRRLKRLLEQAEPAPAGGETVPPEAPPADEGGAGGDEVETKIKDFVKKMGELIQDTLGVEVKVEEGEGEEEGKEPEGEVGAPPPAAGAGAPPAPAPAPMAEAINRLVNKVARRVKARLMEAMKESEKKKLSKKELEDLEGLEAHYGEEMRAGIKGKHSHKSRMAALQAAKSKELEDLEGLEKHYGEEMRAGIKGKHSHKSRMKDIEAAKSNLKEKQMAAKKKEMMMKKKKAAMSKKK